VSDGIFVPLSNTAHLIRNSWPIAEDHAAQAALTRRLSIPAEAWWRAVLAKIRRTLRAEDVQVIRTNAGVCVDLARQQEPAFPGTEARA
jgi:hypothetical protein